MNIFIHRRDLRIYDNTGIMTMLNKHQPITPIFIFDPIQIDPDNNPYFSNNLVQFMCQSLKDLHQQYSNNNVIFHLFHGDIISVLQDIHINNTISTIGFNMDYSPYSKNRDQDIIQWCQKNNINYFYPEDMLLNDILNKNSINPNSNKPYLVYTPFKNNLLKYDVNKPVALELTPNKDIIKSKYLIDIKEFKQFYQFNPDLHIDGGRNQALKTLKQTKKLNDYNNNRNLLTYTTTNLSSAINLGLLSIREVYHYIIDTLGKDSDIINELYWREFYYNILYYFPQIVGNSFHSKYDNIKWNNNTIFFDKWKQGITGFPIVDACIRQLNQTGYMHNRGRMIVASFLTKDLLIDWRWGEKYFATQLIDYNISANNGGWQWCAGTGTDSQPYFRIFNPWTQSKNFDPQCVFIKKWIPELSNIDSKYIHNWNKYHHKFKTKYPSPMIEHDIARKETLKVYQNL